MYLRAFWRLMMMPSWLVAGRPRKVVVVLLLQRVLPTAAWCAEEATENDWTSRCWAIRIHRDSHSDTACRQVFIVYGAIKEVDGMVVGMQKRFPSYCIGKWTAYLFGRVSYEVVCRSKRKDPCQRCRTSWCKSSAVITAFSLTDDYQRHHHYVVAADRTDGLSSSSLSVCRGGGVATTTSTASASSSRIKVTNTNRSDCEMGRHSSSAQTNQARFLGHARESIWNKQNKQS